MSLKNPKITVLLSVYNDEKYIGESIDSILDQTFKDFELLIVDDCSTDGTVDVIRKYKDSRIRLVVNKKNVDITRSLNKGLKLARGKYIARLDSDDVSIPKRLEKQFNFLEDNKDYAAVGSRTEYIDGDGNHIGYWKQEISAEEIFYALSYRCCLTSSSMMFNRETVSKIGNYDESSSHAEDYEIFYRISRKHKIYVIPEYLIKYRIRENQRLVINNSPTRERTFKIASNTKIDRELLEYLQNRKEEKSFFKRIKLIKELYRFQINIQKEGIEIGLSGKKLKSICCKKIIIFIIKIMVGKKGKILLKKILRME